MTTAPSAGRLLISHITLRGPELAQLYALIAEQGELEYAALVDVFVPVAGETPFDLAEAPLREALNFLSVAGLVEQLGSSRRKARFRVTPVRDDLAFPLLLLHHIGCREDERQRAIRLIYGQLVAADAISTTVATLRNTMERGPYRTLFAWTSEKITFWTHLCDYLGLLRRLERSSEIIVAPRPSVVLAALEAARPVRSGDSSLAEMLASIDEHFFACFTARSRVHRGLTQALLTLEQEGRLTLQHNADAAQSLLLGERRVSTIAIADRQDGVA